MKKLLTIFLALIFSNISMAQEILINKFVDKRNYDEIEVFCLPEGQGSCAKINIYSTRNGEKSLINSFELSLEEVIRDEEIRVLDKTKFDNLKLTNKACKISNSNRVYCFGSSAIPYGVAVSVAILANPISGLGALALTSLFMLGTDAGISSALVIPAFMGDAVRQITIKPVKKIVGGFKKRYYKKKIEPILWDLNNDLLENNNEHSEEIFLRHNVFKRIRTILSASQT